MKRRSVLKRAAITAATGSAGCTQFIPDKQYRLWFIRIHNGSIIEQDVDIKVLRGEEVVFEHQYDDIISFREDESTKSSFAAMDNARLIEGEWEPKSSTYTIEYRFSGQDPYKRVEVGETGDFDAEDIGLDMTMQGDSEWTSVGFKPFEYKSEGQVTRFLTTVTNQSAN